MSLLSEQLVIDMRELIGSLVSVHSLVFFFSDVYCFFDPMVRFVAFTVDHLCLIPVCDMFESDGVVCDR